LACYLLALRGTEIKIIHHTSVIDGRENSGTARLAKEIILQINTRTNFQQYLLHYDQSDSEIYSLSRTCEVKLKKNSKSKYRFVYFALYCIKLRIRNLFYSEKIYFDVSHWHVFRVYPFFWFLPAKKHIISMHDAGHFILPYTQTFYNRIFIWNIRKNLDKIYRLLVLSEDAKSNLIKYGSFPENKIEIVYPGSEFHRIKPRNPFSAKNALKPESFIVCVSRWQPHKNVEKLVEAFNKYINIDKNSNLKLVLVGKPVGQHVLPFEKIIEFGLEERILVLSDLSDAELAWLYDHALFSVFPSLHEGFGLPILESLSRHCPSIVDSNTSTAEVVGNAGLCVDMRSSGEIASAIQELISSPDFLNLLKDNCLNRTNFFTWKRSISKLCYVYS
jgi:glycosyltransferase involved in cell wall biosynthesis